MSQPYVQAAKDDPGSCFLTIPADCVETFQRVLQRVASVDRGFLTMRLAYCPIAVEKPPVERGRDITDMLQPDNSRAEVERSLQKIIRPKTGGETAHESL